MRVRATRVAVAVAGLCGPLALTALTVPAAQATPSTGDTKFTHVIVNNGFPVVVGAAQRKTFNVSVTVTDPSGVESIGIELWHGKDREHADSRLAPLAAPVCTDVNATTMTCDFQKVVADPKDRHLGRNSFAGKWQVRAVVETGDGDIVRADNVGNQRILRATQLTVDASPEPVKKNKPLEVTGKLTVANWETHKNVAYVGQPVKLQFRAGTSGPFVNLKTVKTDRMGWLKTTVKATADGQYRFNYGGTSITQQKSSALDSVDVK